MTPVSWQTIFLMFMLMNLNSNNGVFWMRKASPADIRAENVAFIDAKQFIFLMQNYEPNPDLTCN